MLLAVHFSVLMHYFPSYILLSVEKLYLKVVLVHNLKVKTSKYLLLKCWTKELRECVIYDGYVKEILVVVADNFSKLLLLLISERHFLLALVAVERRRLNYHLSIIVAMCHAT